MKEYRRRVLFAFQSLEGDGDNEEKERRDLAKKKKAFARRLLNGLHGEAWRTCQGLITEPEKLSEEQGFKHVLSALQSIEKVTVVKKTEQFDRFFERGFRKKGQPLDQYLRVRRQDWADLKDLDEHTSMSDDLLAYFILKQCGLGRDERRQILLNSGSSYDLDSIERAMRVSFHDIHERERQKNFDDRRPKGSGKSRKHFAHLVEEDEVHAEIDALENERASAYESVHEYEHASEYDKVTEYDKVLEYDAGTNYEHGYGVNDEPDEEPSDFGASGDDEIYAAFATMDKQRNTYQESRKRLRDIQRQRGFFKGELTFEQRKAAVAKEKERSRCPACGRMGHWAGDKECPVNNRAAGPHRSKGGGKHKKKGSGKGKAYLVSEQPLFFSLDDDDSGDVVEANSQMMAYMVGESAEFNLMDQDAGYTEQDDRRKIRQSAPSYVDDGQSDTPWAVVDPHPSLPVMQKNQEPGSPSSRDQIIRRQLQQPVRVEQSQVQIVPVANLAVLCPEIESMKVEELKKECERWGIRVSGNRSELRSRLWSLFAGHPVARKGCVKQFVMLEEDDSYEATPVYEGLRDPRPQASASKKTPVVMYSPEMDPPSRPGTKSAAAPPADAGHEEDGRFFRSPGERGRVVVQDMQSRGYISAPSGASSTSESASRSEDKKPISGTEKMPVEVGEILPMVRCTVCGSDMVLRQNSYNQSYFFGCSKFGRTGCRSSLAYDRGIKMSQDAHRRFRGDWWFQDWRARHWAFCICQWAGSAWWKEFKPLWWAQSGNEWNPGRAERWVSPTQPQRRFPNRWAGRISCLLAWYCMHFLHAQWKMAFGLFSTPARWPCLWAHFKGEDVSFCRWLEHSGLGLEDPHRFGWS